MSDRILRWAFVAALVMLAFGYGALTVQFRIFPYFLMRSIGYQIVTLYQFRESHLGIEPTRWLRPARHRGDGVTIDKLGDDRDDLTFMTGFFGDAVAMQLIDMDGRLVHRWIDTTSWNTPEIHGAVPLPDGSVVVARIGAGLRRLDKCGEEMWRVDRDAHHSVFLSEDDTLWVSARRLLKAGDPALAHLPGVRPPFTEETALQVSLDGQVLREISLTRVLLEAGLEGALFPTGEDDIGNRSNEFTHLNDVEVLQAADAAAFPMFTAGDVMASMRNINLVFAFDPDSLQVKWYQTGPWSRQHDPDFQSDGTITIFNNRRDGTSDGSVLGGSTIVRIEPLSRTVETRYEGTDAHPFYTEVLGKHQVLANGNIFISGGHEGRIFEVTPAGEIVWEFIHRYDADRVYMLHEGTRYPRDYFDVEDWRCD